jgi:hypothetical protein
MNYTRRLAPEERLSFAETVRIGYDPSWIGTRPPGWSDKDLRTRSVVGRGLYGAQLAHAQSLFPAEQLHLLDFHAFVKERDCLTKSVREDIIDCCQKTVRLEDAFIDLAFEQGPVPGMTPKEIKRYIRYIADWRLGQLGFQPLLNGVEHANFFETRATEYSKAATRGDWNTVWTSFDSRKKAKANDDPAAASSDDGGDDMFKQAGIAAE